MQLQFFNSAILHSYEAQAHFLIILNTKTCIKYTSSRHENNPRIHEDLNIRYLVIPDEFVNKKGVA